MTSAAALAAPLTELLGLAYPPVAITFNAEPASSGGENFPAQPAGCCFWEPAQRHSLDTLRTTPTAAQEVTHTA